MRPALRYAASADGSLADTVGVQKPFRYRMYYYHKETGKRTQKSEAAKTLIIIEKVCKVDCFL